MLEPPGTIRTPSSGLSRLTGHVDLSIIGCRTGFTDISTVTPMRNPSSTPFLTHVFTRQPLRAEESGSAERIFPEFRACLKRWNSAKWSSV